MSEDQMILSGKYIKFNFPSSVCFRCTRSNCRIVKYFYTQLGKDYKQVKIKVNFKILGCRKLLTGKMIIQKIAGRKEAERIKEKFKKSLLRTIKTPIEEKIIRLREKEGMTFRQIGLEMGIDFRMVNYYYRKATDQLRVSWRIQ